MKDLMDMYYSGYEGEPEIQIIRKNGANEELVLRIWAGFFDNIMNAIEPERTGWTSLAYYYNLYVGWYEESPWLLEDIKTAIEQLKSIDSDKLNRGGMEVLTEIIDVFEEAIRAGDSILISYE